jgi:hypothetical protein
VEEGYLVSPSWSQQITLRKIEKKKNLHRRVGIQKVPEILPGQVLRRSFQKRMR